MIPVALPPLPAGTWLAVILEAHAIAGCSVHSVTVRSRGGTAANRDWFADPDQALAYALTQSDGRRLPFLDLRDGGGE